MNPRMSDAFALVAGAAVILGGAWWMLNRRAGAATLPAAGRAEWEPATFVGRPGNTAEYQAWIGDNYYGPDGSAIVLDARDALLNRGNHVAANDTRDADLLAANPFLLAAP